MKKLFGLITASIIFSQTAMSLTQTPVLSFESRRLSVKDGLPSNFVNSLYQDADGYVWIGTGSGLCRYDGFNIYNFKNLGPDNGQHKVGVADLYGQDNGNTLRIETTTNDVALYDLNTATFTSYLPDAGPMMKKK